MKLDRFKKNLRIESSNVISYKTHVATLDIPNETLWRQGYWSRTTTKHINYVAKEYNLIVKDKPEGK